MDEDDHFQPGNFVDFYESFKVAAREKRFIVREYSKKDEAGAGEAKDELAEVEVQVAEKQAGLERWCRTHYGEVFSAWVHLKVVRAFVESILRYGLSPLSGVSVGAGQQQSNFTLAVLKVHRGRGAQLKAALDKLLHVSTTAVAVDDGEDAEEYSPYCKLEFSLV